MLTECSADTTKGTSLSTTNNDADTGTREHSDEEGTGKEGEKRLETEGRDATSEDDKQLCSKATWATAEGSPDHSEVRKEDVGG